MTFFASAWQRFGRANSGCPPVSRTGTGPDVGIGSAQGKRMFTQIAPSTRALIFAVGYLSALSRLMQPETFPQES